MTVCRAIHEGGNHPGYFTDEYNGYHIGDGNKEYKSNIYIILIGDNARVEYNGMIGIYLTVITL